MVASADMNFKISSIFVLAEIINFDHFCFQDPDYKWKAQHGYMAGTWEQSIS